MNHHPGGCLAVPNAETTRLAGGARRFFVFRLFALTFGGALLLYPGWSFAQQLDTDIHPKPGKSSAARAIERYIPPGFQQPQRQPANPAFQPAAQTSKIKGNAAAGGTATTYSSAPALTATVTHTLYLPPAMYGQWNVTGTLMKTNAPDFFSPSVSDIWLLEREGNQVTVTNPVNGAYATISVDKAEGDQATFHRSGTAGKHAIYQEIPTITVHGDTFSGQSVNKVQNIRDGHVVSELYGIYHLEATRISAARTRFHPETEQQNPDLQIEEIQH